MILQTKTLKSIREEGHGCFLSRIFSLMVSYDNNFDVGSGLPSIFLDLERSFKFNFTGVPSPLFLKSKS